MKLCGQKKCGSIGRIREGYLTPDSLGNLASQELINILAGIVKMGMWHFVASFPILFAVFAAGIIVKQIAQIREILQRQIFRPEFRIDRQCLQIGIRNQIFQ